MLFMGSQKYKSTTAFSECITKYQGSENAYTSQRRTVYFFNLVD
jgi:secreted Zn-dependent insulinase-like peptidase